MRGLAVNIGHSRAITIRMNGVRMNTSQKIGLAAVAVFVASYFMPAFDTLPGFACFLQCWDTMWHFDPSDLGNWFYYSGFVLSNILLPILVIGLFVSHKGWRIRRIVSIVMLLQTASWSVLEFSAGSSSIKIGYYVWLEAYVLLFFAHCSKENGCPGPVGPSRLVCDG